MLKFLKKVFPQKNIYTILILLSFLTNHKIMSEAVDQQVAFAKNSGLFAVDLYRVVAQEQPNKNIVFSPFSIQTCIAMARMGAEGQTAQEIDRGLHLISSDTTAIADSFQSVLANYVDSSILKIANKIYFMKGYHLRKEFNDILTKKFFSSSESINFVKNENAAKAINNWVESKTNNLIKNIVTPDDFDADTRLVLLNAIHFKGTWKYQFPKQATTTENFYLNDVDTVKVPLMSVKATFRYADLPELDATALEMPYTNSDLSMLVILPNSRTGLKSVEEKLATSPLSIVTEKLYSTEVFVQFPKFRAEFSLELKSALQKMGMSRMFTNAELGKMLEEPEPLSVSKVIHKAFIEVNEEGTEAAAATGVQIMRVSAIRMNRRKRFIVNHPFIFILKSPNAALLIGSMNLSI